MCKLFHAPLRGDQEFVGGGGLGEQLLAQPTTTNKLLQGAEGAEKSAKLAHRINKNTACAV